MSFFLISKPFFHLNTSVNCMHFLVFIFFFFVWCYVFVLSLNFSSFLHCNYNTSLFDLFFKKQKKNLFGLVVLFVSHQAVEESCIVDSSASHT